MVHKRSMLKSTKGRVKRRKVRKWTAKVPKSHLAIVTRLLMGLKYCSLHASSQELVSIDGETGSICVSSSAFGFGLRRPRAR